MRKNATKLAAAVLSLAMVMTSVSVPASAAKTKKAKLNKTKATLYTNGSKSQKSTTLKLTVGGKKVKATFKSSNTKLLTVGKTTGKVTAKKNGTATVTATYKKKAYKCKITVKTYATSVSVKAKTLTLKEGKTATIKTTVKPSTASNKKVSFTSSNKSVATVSSKGKVTAKKAGTAKITVKALGAKKGVKAATVTVKVEKATPAPTETPLVTESPVPTETPSVATEGTITVSANISGVGIKVVSGTAVYAAGTAEGTSFTTAKLPNGTYEVVVSKAGYDDVVVPVVVNGDVAVTAELKNVSLAVSSVKAINAKQIEVKFNNTMDRATAEKDANFDIKPLNTKDNFPTRNNISDITLQDDAQTVVITLEEAMTNGYEYEVTINKEVKSAAGKNLTEKSVTKVVSNDSTRPTTTSIKTLAPNLLQVTFSEPVWIANPSTNIEFVTVDSTGKELDDVLSPVVKGYGIVSASNGETSYVIKLDKNLKQGSNYNLYVGGGNGISDYAGLRLTAEKHTFTYEADKEVTAVKNFTLLDGKTAKVSFTKPIDLDNSQINVYYNVDGVQGNQIAIGKVNPSTDAQSIKVTFDKLIPGGVKYFFVDGAYDLAGNKVEIGKFNITVPEYKAAEVSSVKLSNKTTIEVEFNQEIDDDNSYFSGDLTHDNKVRANIVLKDKDGKNVDIKNVEVGKDSKDNNDYAKRIITLYKDLGEGNNTLTIDNLVDELGRKVVSYKGTVSYANSTEFSAKLKAGKTEDNDKTVAVLSIDESKTVPTQASVENLKNWTVDTTYGKKTLAEVAGARVKMVSNDVYLVEADKNAFNTGSSVVLSNLETATGLTIPSTTVDAGDVVSDINELAKTKGDVSFDGTTATINLNNVIIGSFSPSDFVIVGTKDGASTPTTLTANEYTVSYSNNTAKDAFSSKIIIKFNNNVKLNKSKGITLKTAERTSTTDIFGRKLQANAAMTISDTSKAAVVGAYIAKTDKAAAEIIVNFDKAVGGKTYAAEDFTVVTKDSKQALKVIEASATDKVLTLKLDSLAGKAYEDVLEKEEVSVSFTKKLSTGDAIASGMSATTNSLRLEKISFGTGASKEKVEKDETITFTYNKTLDQDLINNISDNSKPKKIKIGGTGSNQTIETELGTFTMSGTNDLIGRGNSSSVDGEVDAEYKVSGNTIVITLTGLGDSKYENKITSKWVDSAVTYSDARSDFNTNDTYFDLATVRALDGTYAAVGDDDALSKASNLATGDMVSYADVENALAKYDKAIKSINVDGDFDAAEAAGDAAKKAVEKVPGGLDHTYYGNTGSGLLKTYDDTFKPYKEVHDVYKTLDADKLQSILNESSITLPSDAKGVVSGSTDTSTKIEYTFTTVTSTGAIAEVKQGDAFAKPEVPGAIKEVNILVKVTSGSKVDTTQKVELTMGFKAKVPYSGTIEVYKNGDASYAKKASE